MTQTLTLYSDRVTSVQQFEPERQEYDLAYLNNAVADIAQHDMKWYVQNGHTGELARLAGILNMLADKALAHAYVGGI